MKFGLIWSVALLWCGDAVVAAVVAPEVALMCRGLVVGSVVSVHVAVLAARGFFDPVACDGSDFVPRSAGGIGQRVLNNRIAQGVLALCIWAAAGSGHGVCGGSGIFLVRVPPRIDAAGFWVCCKFYPTVIGLL